MRPRSERGRKSGNTRTRLTTDHDEIRAWAEMRGAWPAHVRGTYKHGDIGMLQLDFPGYSDESRLEEISWDQFFLKFDDANLAFLFQEDTNTGERSNHYKLVKYQEVEDVE